MRSLIILIAASSLLIGCSPKASEQTRIVNATGGLKLRAEPNAQSATLALIPNGSEVVLLRESGDAVTISDKTGHWSEVKFQGKTGWVFGGFLSSPAAGEPSASSKTIDPAFQGIAGNYFATGSVEPGNMSDWLSISASSISFGRGGMMETNWYCLIASVTLSGNEMNITCDNTRSPTSKEVEFGAAQAEKKDRISILVNGASIKIDGRTFDRR